MDITFDSDFDKFYSYRTAIICASIWIKLTDEQIKEIKWYIEKINNKKFDNHICWTLKDGTCFMYSDRSLGIGQDIKIEKW